MGCIIIIIVIGITHPGMMRKRSNGLGSKKASTFFPQSELRRQHVADETPGSTGEVKKSSLDHLRAERRPCYGGAAFLALEPAGNAGTQSPPD